jgi:chromosome segregation ATPase
MATAEQGIENLRHFIADLTSASAALVQVTQALEDAKRDVSQLEGVASEQGGGLNEDLEEIRSRLEAGETAAVRAVEDLAARAEAAQQVLHEARTQLEQAGHHFEEGARTLAADLDEGHVHLTQDGFAALATQVDQVERELEGARTESGQVWTELEGALTRIEAESQADWTEAQATLDGAVADAASRETSLETEASAAVQGLEALAGELDGACAALDDELDAIYDGCVAGIDAIDAELASMVQRLGDEGAAFIQAGTEERLTTPAAELETEGLEPLQLEYSLVLVALTSGLAVAAALGPLAQELAKCQAVVAQVDHLLNAMA